MQERNSEKNVSLSVKATKVTASVLKSAVKTYLSAQKNKSPNLNTFAFLPLLKIRLRY